MIPDFQMIMLPLLKFADDKAEHSIREAIEFLAVEFKITSEERMQRLPSGLQTIFENRTHWAKTHLVKAQLLEPTQRGHFVITKQGLKSLSQNPDKINVSKLKEYPQYIDFVQPSKLEEHPIIEYNTPSESLEKSYLKLQQELAEELLQHILQKSPFFFERLVLDLLLKMGYGGFIENAGQLTPKSGDGGIDGIIKEDKLGLDMIYIQAKKWDLSHKVGRPDIQNFVGALAGYGAKKGIFITTSTFSKDARQYIPRNETKIVLLDGQELTKLLIDHNVGVQTKQTLYLKKMDMDYFEGI